MTHTDANEIARTQLRTRVREALDAFGEGRANADAAEQAIMDAAQQWVVTGYLVNARPES